jgi:hypothetical protein
MCQNCLDSPFFGLDYTIMNNENQEKKKRTHRKLTTHERLVISYIASNYNRSFNHVSNVFTGSKKSLLIARALEKSWELPDEYLIENTGPPTSNGKKVACKCPRCGIIYTRNFFWTGDGMPRKYCTPCHRSLFETDEEQLQKTKRLFRDYTYG